MNIVASDIDNLLSTNSLLSICNLQHLNSPDAVIFQSKPDDFLSEPTPTLKFRLPLQPLWLTVPKNYSYIDIAKDNLSRQLFGSPNSPCARVCSFVTSNFLDDCSELLDIDDVTVKFGSSEFSSQLTVGHRNSNSVTSSSGQLAPGSLIYRRRGFKGIRSLFDTDTIYGFPKSDSRSLYPLSITMHRKLSLFNFLYVLQELRRSDSEVFLSADTARRIQYFTSYSHDLNSRRISSNIFEVRGWRFHSEEGIRNDTIYLLNPKDFTFCFSDFHIIDRPDHYFTYVEIPSVLCCSNPANQVMITGIEL